MQLVALENINGGIEAKEMKYLMQVSTGTLPRGPKENLFCPPLQKNYVVLTSEFLLHFSWHQN